MGEQGFQRLVLGIKAFFLVLGVVLGGFSCYVWGKMTSQRASAQAEPIRVIYPPPPLTSGDLYHPKTNLTPSPSPARGGEQHQASNNMTGNTTNWKFAASKTGKVYYPNGCKGVNRIKSENRVYFSDLQQVTSKGLTLAKSCE